MRCCIAENNILKFWNFRNFSLLRFEKFLSKLRQNRLVRCSK
ncbi:hypothetical protein ANACOL_02098 [Anaerotruncus colihominis DSM 17241]|uniref:Uncharacterized protein n=1 Tax=Anaerotruncus colihominis DSM 17241 TaxID=445972 RepID=B0PBE7_9FIRM|nr:hypothetical protein ANACOL_02098 [Anaerotruncus colihominis DSM 17241]